ncbi:hypothetical protein DXD68_09390 [Parabacteroides sp. TM07-1AC]|jgi:hypothetical protein|uniref:hypothetical protein n=1 Tax=Parabacteroides sp. TM07-1AC TaxID=2292363 RepID=UPI000F009970|nr:hypothetical protein [Parabacteroides sp. TM07-1AC]RHU28105.1 hypothetical protein DXD68_09390 [Parabacteroides sp. TM07-1AC]
MRKTQLLFICFFILSTVLSAQTNLKKANWEWNISQDGLSRQLIFKGKRSNDTIPFFSGKKNDGPSFYVRMDGKEYKAEWIPNGYASFRTSLFGVKCELTYREYKSVPTIEVKLHNSSAVPFQPEKAGLKLGVDTYMDKYPDWFGKYFPTLMRCEKTHFYGYLQTPSEHTLGIVSEQPIASWSVDYNLGYMDPPPHWFMGHRIESLNLDLMNELPLPDRNPQNLYELKQGETKTWLISFINIGTLDNLESEITRTYALPLLKIEQTTYQPGDKASFEVYATSPEIQIIDDKGKILPVSVRQSGKGKSEVTSILPETGLYTVTVTDGKKQSEAILLARHSWQWVMEQARLATLKYHQKATSHAESWYGFYSAFLAARYFPDQKLDKQVSLRFNYLFDLLHDSAKMEPKYYASRIQNTSTTIGMLVDKYEAQKDINDLNKAALLADWMIRFSQREDGAYYNHGTIYTSVIYVAKSILELALAEKELAEKDPVWKDAYNRHYTSAKRAIDQLVASQGDFQTEGELTFEDGMISCSALQIGMLAVLEKDGGLRKHYTDAMLKILNSHDCLTQLRVPDARRRQGTMRYWEAQYDVQMLPNMFNSPHGWSAWRAYATYYAYLLTGEEKWLMQTFNAMGAFSNLLDYKTGDLRWAFVVDPHLKVEQACSADTHYTADSLSFGNPHPRLYETRQFVIGEQYVNMISDWQTVNTQDNDVHELFKCIGETVLTNAFIIERPDGSVKGYNCDVKRKGNALEVSSFEKQIVHLHCNLKQACQVKFKPFKGKNLEKTIQADFCDWIF